MFRFGLKYRSVAPVAVRIYFPAGKLRSITINGVATEVTSWDAATRVSSFTLPPSRDFRLVDVSVRK